MFDNQTSLVLLVNFLWKRLSLRKWLATKNEHGMNSQAWPILRSSRFNYISVDWSCNAFAVTIPFLLITIWKLSFFLQFVIKKKSFLNLIFFSSMDSCAHFCILFTNPLILLFKTLFFYIFAIDYTIYFKTLPINDIKRHTSSFYFIRL